MKRILVIGTGLWLIAMAATANAEGYPVRTVYGPATQQKLTGLSSVLKEGRVLESLSTLLSVSIDWPQPITLAAAQCGQSNAFYTKENQAIVLCYELIQEIFDRVPKDRTLQQLTPEQKTNVASGAIFAILLHEAGHALVNLYDLPALGREEDVADQISTYLLLGMRDSEMSLLGGITYFNLGKPLFNVVGSRRMADEHSLNPQRTVNIACWAFGRDPQRYSFLARVAGLTQQRASRCAGEYNQLSKAVTQLLGDRIHF